MEPRIVSTPSGLELAYEEFLPRSRKPTGPPLLLVMGLGAQMLLWPDGLCQALADAGHRVIRFDNRDVGLSSHLDHLPVPNLPSLYVRLKLLGSVPEPSYTLSDMANDAVELLDALQIDRVCAIGASMGGMIVQRLGIHHADRLSSAVSVMSSTRPAAPQPHVMPLLLKRPKPGREAAVAHTVRWFELIGSQSMPLDQAAIAAVAGKMFDRGPSPRGFARHLHAILFDGCRAALLEKVTTPFLVIHGDEDPLIPVKHGIHTANALKARIRILPGMGHDLPHPHWGTLVQELSGHAHAHQ